LYNLDMLTLEETNEYKKRLGAEKERLLREIKKDSRPTDFGNDVDAGDEEADEAEEFSNKLATRQILQDRVNKIDAALEKVQKGTYGICEKCGKEISKEVLDLVPESECCKDCK